jgi:hypothetical protein
MTGSSVKVGMTALLLLALGLSTASAQGGATSSITGVVADAQGGVVPGATATAVNDATGGKFTAVSGSDGGFTVPAVPVGTYTVTITLQGFKNAVLKGVRVTAAQPANVRATLEVGGLQDTITVEAASAMIQTQTSVAATTINTQQISFLPVTSRNTLDFVQFLPGVQTQGSVRDSTVAGLPQSTINITVDGVNVQDNHLKTTDGFFARMSPRLDAVEEVTLTTAAQGADASGQGAAQIRFTTRSGTNQYVTSLYYFFQSDQLNSNTYSNEVRGLPKGPLTLHQPGGRIGGPVVLPGFDGRGRAFFFVNYEHFYQPSTITSASVLFQPHVLTGLFKYPGNPAGVNLLELAARNGVLATSDPVVLQLLTDMRNSTQSGAVGLIEPIEGDLNLERYRFQQPGQSNNKFPTVRLDYNLSDRHRLSFSTNRNHILSNPDTTNSRQRRFPEFPNFGEQASIRYQITGSLRSTLGASLVNELRVGGSGGPTQFSPSINAGMFSGSMANQAGFTFDIDNTGITNPTANTSNSSREPTTRLIGNTLTWLKGAHGISTGFEYTGFGIWLDSGNVVTELDFGVLDGDPAESLFTAANFPGSSSGDRSDAMDLYALLVGSVSQITATARRDSATGDYVYNGRSFQEGRLRQFDLFFQDSWRARPNLSLNLGLRYAVQPAFYALNNSYSGATADEVWGISGFVPGCEFNDPLGTGCNIFRPGVMPGAAPFYSPLDARMRVHQTDLNNIAPGIGVNYTPDTSGVPGLRRLFGAQSESSFSAGWVRAYSRVGMNSYTGVLDNNPGLNLAANRTTGNGNLGPVPLYLRNGDLGGPPLCSVSNTPGCMLDRPEYPFFNTTDTGSITMIDPNLRVAYSDTYTAGWQRQLARNFAFEVRYLGSRARDEWSTQNYNEPALHENGFLEEFRLAQQNLTASIAGGCGGAGNPCTFAYRGPGTGTSPLPIYLAYFSGSADAGNPARYSSSLWTSSNFINPLGLYTADVFTPAGTNANTGLAGSASRRANALSAGLPANFFVANPNMLGGALALTNAGFTRYNSVQLMVRRRLSNGLQFDVNYVFGKAFVSNFDSFRVARVTEPNVGEDVRHAFKGNWIYEIPVGRGRRFGRDLNPWLNGFLGGWMYSGTFRIQSGDLEDLGNIRVVGMSDDEVRELFRLRKVNAGLAYSWPQEIIDETMKAFNTSATSPTGYAGEAPSGKYFAPASHPGCFETISSDRGDCGVRNFLLRGPMRFQMDWSVRKSVPMGGRRVFELSVDVFNPLNFTQWGSEIGLSEDLDDWEVGLPGSSRRIQIGTRFTF